MKTLQSSSSLLFPPTLLSSIVTFSDLTVSQTDTSYYDICEPYRCGNLTFPFPFSSSLTFGTGPRDCGLPRYQITCDPISSRPSLDLSGKLYQVSNIFPSDTERLITLVDTQLIQDMNSSSCRSLRNLPFTTTDIAPLKLPPWGINLTFIDCPKGHLLSHELYENVVSNYSCQDGRKVYLWSANLSSVVVRPSGCELLMVPVSGPSLARYGFLNTTSNDEARSLVFDVLSEGFPLEWPDLKDCQTCQQTGGRCGFDGGSGKIVCFCKGGCQPVKHQGWKLLVGVVTGGSVLLLAAVLLLIIKFKRRTLPNFIKKQTTVDGEKKSKEFIKNYRSSLLTNYSYNDIKKMANGFNDKLGKGGYGSVYKGNMTDGHPIAVKMLDNLNGISHDFFNEVTTIGRIHHVHVIRLLGFSWDGSKQALIYDYMPNGSLGDLLAKEEASPSLGLTRMLEIAIGVAHGIEYLHVGCESRILHLDLKPQNILLDNDFIPKISDFGLAKVHSRNKSAVTMTGAGGGTIGYIAPEIFLRNLGNPSHKSDVYSYGMVLLDMIGGRKNDNLITSNSSEAYFPGWIYDKLIEEQDIHESVIEEEVSIVKKMAMVGLWCIQINPRERPSITKVVEMLTGNVEAIEMPPKPFFFSPPRVQFEHEGIISSGSHSSILPPFSLESLQVSKLESDFCKPLKTWEEDQLLQENKMPKTGWRALSV